MTALVPDVPEWVRVMFPTNAELVARYWLLQDRIANDCATDVEIHAHSAIARYARRVMEAA